MAETQKEFIEQIEQDRKVFTDEFTRLCKLSAQLEISSEPHDKKLQMEISKQIAELAAGLMIFEQRESVAEYWNKKRLEEEQQRIEREKIKSQPEVPTMEDLLKKVMNIKGDDPAVIEIEKWKNVVKDYVDKDYVDKDYVDKEITRNRRIKRFKSLFRNLFNRGKNGKKDR